MTFGPWLGYRPDREARPVERHETALAKVNLTLEVGPRRADGYHPVLSHVQAISLADEVRVRPLSPGAPLPVRVGVRGGAAPRGARNLALSAAALWRTHTGVGRVAIALRKRIPAGAGLGGGSSDAAAVLRALARLFPGRTDGDALTALAARLGSDVPFFAAGHAAALATGRGERLAPAPALPRAWRIVLVKPPRRLDTAVVYRAFDALAAGAGAMGAIGTRTDALVAMLAAEQEGGGGDEGEQALRAMAADGLLGSDLWPAALRLLPELGSVRGRLQAAVGSAWPVAMTGSGSALFALVPEPGRAAHAVRSLGREGLWTFVAAPGATRAGQEAGA